MSPPLPILILQMQRMGDLVLSFPLVAWLNSLYPSTPVWIVGEKVFFEGLIEISPPATFFSYNDAQALKTQHYSLIINLSHRAEAAKLAGELQAKKRIGPYITPENNLYISGKWQLYRASISHNNRHNLFHWADLNAMDVIPPTSMGRTSWPPVKTAKSSSTAKIGLFVGASEPDKRPEPEFWAQLATRLIKMGFKPVFLGGDADKKLAAKAADILHAPAMNLSGHFSIVQLCHFISGLELLIVPDTGPMHIAAWTGVPTLNLSIGPVNAWETAPFAPGHYVLHSALSCTGCWVCTQKSVLCKSKLKAEQVAFIAQLIIENKYDKLAQLDHAAGLIYRTDRDALGLFNLELLNAGIKHSKLPSLRTSIGNFWKLFFALELGFAEARDKIISRRNATMETILQYGFERILQTSGQKLLVDISRTIQKNSCAELYPKDYWLYFPPIVRPLSSYTQFILQNDDFSKASLIKALNLVESYLQSLNPK